VYARSTPQPPSLPLPARDIPKNLNPPLADGRIDYHGWLWLPIDNSQSDSKLVGWFYHHTPEFFHNSPHDFEIMTFAELELEKNVQGLPFPPQINLLGNEYVFTPPAFSLDLLILQKEFKYHGRFTNGSFDTHQRYLLSDGTLQIKYLPTVHYLEANAPAGYHNLVYLSYPRKLMTTDDEIQHFYLLHLLEKSPDFDQLVHVSINITTCVWKNHEDLADLAAIGATYQINIFNDVYQRLYPRQSDFTLNLITQKSRGMTSLTQCSMTVLEEVHCVVVPDSFARCPPPK